MEDTLFRLQELDPTNNPNLQYELKELQMTLYQIMTQVNSTVSNELDVR